MPDLAFLEKILYTEGMNNEFRPLEPVPVEDPPSDDPPVKRYPFRFSAAILALLIAGIALSIAGFGLTAWQFTGFLRGGDLSSVYEWLKYLILFFVSLMLLVLLASMLVRSEYVLTPQSLTIRFGLIRSRYPLKTIYSVHLFRGANKLAVYFDDFKTKYMVIVVKDIWYTDFIRSLIERNPRIGLSFSTAEEEEEFKKKK